LRKIAYILLVVITTAGCAVSRKHKRGNNEEGKLSESVMFYENIVNQNITSRNFFVERAEFKIKTEDGEKFGVGTIKFKIPDKFLISIKSRTGVEVARIFLTGDSIMVNDRFDKKLFYGSTSYLKEKYGLTTSILPVIFGDYVNDNKNEINKMECTDGKLNLEGIVNDVRIKYEIDCEYGKSILTIPEDNLNESELTIKYNDFFKADNINIPEKIEISDRQRNTVIEIKIEKIVIPWNGTIEFIPGKQYEKIHLL
jgi:Domain of unknown function (DUF4292)